MKALFPVSHKEKFLYLDDREENEEDWKSELDHVEGLLASRAVSVIKVDWKDPGFPCRIPHDMHFLLQEQDIKHLNRMLQDDDNDFRFFHQLGLLNAYLQVAPEGSDDAHKTGGYLELHINMHSSVPMVVKISSPRMAETKQSGTPMCTS